MVEVVSWNIQKGIGTDLRRDLARTARVLGAIGADLVGLQEVLRTGEVDQAETLAGALGMALAWGPARAVKDGTYGNALLVRGDVLETRLHDLSVGRREPRACLEALASTRGLTTRVFVCHFGLGIGERAIQAERLTEILRAAPRDVPRVVLGDFNELRAGPVHRAIGAEFPGAPPRVPTHPSMMPVFALDRMAWDPPLQGTLRGAPVVGASDHRMLHATLG
jgi:endonuclease/exonuclease/phosphatase family metal-dependent hydrolase